VKTVDIAVQSVSDILFIHSTLKNGGLVPEGKTWSFLVGQSEVVAVQKVNECLVSVERRGGAHLVSWTGEKYAAPGVEQIGTLYGADEKWAMNKPSGGFTVFKHVMTRYWWIDERAQKDKFYAGDLWEKDTHRYYIYSFGLPSDFQAIVSTIPFKLVVNPVTVQGGELPLPVLLEHKTSREWYRAVIEANAVRNNAWITGVRKITSIINGLIPPSKGVAWKNYALEAGVTEYDPGHSGVHDDGAWRQAAIAGEMEYVRFEQLKKDSNSSASNEFSQYLATTGYVTTTTTTDPTFDSLTTTTTTTTTDDFQAAPAAASISF